MSLINMQSMRNLSKFSFLLCLLISVFLWTELFVLYMHCKAGMSASWFKVPGRRPWPVTPKQPFPVKKGMPLSSRGNCSGKDGRVSRRVQMINSFGVWCDLLWSVEIFPPPTLPVCGSGEDNFISFMLNEQIVTYGKFDYYNDKEHEVKI